MSDNGSLTPTPSRTVIASAGDDLFGLAARYLGDATKWNQISDLNPQLGGDPLITQQMAITLPIVVIASNGGLIGR